MGHFGYFVAVSCYQLISPLLKLLAIKRTTNEPKVSDKKIGPGMRIFCLLCHLLVAREVVNHLIVSYPSSVHSYMHA